MNNDKDLCIGILMQTVADWRWLISNKIYLEKERNREKPNAHNEVTFEEIREFFKSDYGEYICDEAGTSADICLKKLEQELKEAIDGMESDKTRIMLHTRKKGGVKNG